MIMTITFNQQIVKKENKMLVLQMIRDSINISRADVAQKTGLNKGTVSTLVAELLNEDLIVELGPGISSGGRRPVLIEFNQKAGYSIGIDIGVNYIQLLLTDLNGKIIYKRHRKTKEMSIEQFEQLLLKEIKLVIQSSPHSTYGIIGIGVAIPGLIDETSSVVFAPNLGWKNYDLKTVLETTFQLPIIIENEANAGAFGEKTFGLAQGVDNLIYISAGIGIGTGIIINGDLYKGEGGFSGEFGHMTVQMNGPKCSCGNYGCWELYASEKFLERNTPKLLNEGDDYLLQLVERALNNDLESVQIFNDTARNLSVGIINIIHAFNPQMIIIGNRLALAKQLLEKQTKQYVSENILTSHQNKEIVRFSDEQFPATALGMSGFTVNQFIHNHFQI